MIFLLLPFSTYKIAVEIPAYDISYFFRGVEVLILATKSDNFQGT